MLAQCSAVECPLCWELQVAPFLEEIGAWWCQRGWITISRHQEQIAEVQRAAALGFPGSWAIPTVTLGADRWRGKGLLCPGGVLSGSSGHWVLPALEGVGSVPPAWDGDLHLLPFHTFMDPNPLEKDRIINVLLVSTYICTHFQCCRVGWVTDCPQCWCPACPVSVSCEHLLCHLYPHC